MCPLLPLTIVFKSISLSYMALNNLEPVFPASITLVALLLLILCWVSRSFSNWTNSFQLWRHCTFHSFCIGSFDHNIHLDYCLPSCEFQLKKYDCTDTFVHVSLHPELCFIELIQLWWHIYVFTCGHFPCPVFMVTSTWSIVNPQLLIQCPVLIKCSVIMNE